MINNIKIKFWRISLVVFALLFNLWNAQTVDLSTHVSSNATAPIEIQWHNSATPNSTTKLASTTITATATPTNYWVYFFDSANSCYSPGKKVTVMSNTCPSTTVNLNSLSVTPAAPTNAVLQWHTVQSGFVQSGAGQTLVATPNAVGNGTYYPVFYDSANNCYSPVGTPVIVAINANCSKNVTANCPSNTYDLTSLTITPSPTAPAVLQWHTVSSGFVQSGVGQTLVSNPSAVSPGTYYPVFYDATAGGCYSPVGTPVVVANGNCSTGCYKLPVLDAGNKYPTKHGITAMGRAGADNSNWPMERQSAWTVLEAKTKGFVINRIKTTAEVNALPNPIEGMMVYDVEADCLKIYTSKDGGTTFGWYCFTTQACPD